MGFYDEIVAVTCTFLDMRLSCQKAACLCMSRTKNMGGDREGNASVVAVRAGAERPPVLAAASRSRGCEAHAIFPRGMGVKAHIIVQLATYIESRCVMPQHVTERDVRGIAEYTRIRLDDDEVKQMTVDLNDIIESLKPITEYNLEGVEPTFHPIGSLSNVMRDDVEVPGFTQEEALMNAPVREGDCFKIPSILGEGGDR